MCNAPLIRSSFEVLQLELARLQPRWKPHAPTYSIQLAVRAAEDFMVAMFEHVKLAQYEHLGEDDQMRVHDAYLRVLSLARALDDARRSEWAADADADVACAFDSAIDVLDALAPCVGYADRALRRVELEGLDVEEACRWIGEQLQPGMPAAGPL